jgi:lysophospholipase L1-like esterase
LHHNGRWLSTKTNLQKAVVGGIAYRTTRPALARNRLNLGAWNGFQEVIFHRRLPIAEVEFDFKLAADAYLAFIFDTDEQGFAGLRLSVNHQFPSLSFRSTPAGRFASTQGLPVASLRAGGWNHLRVAFTNGGASIHLNDTEPIAISAAVPNHKAIGFRGGFRDVFVDNVRATSADGRVVIRESFSNATDWIRAAPAALVLVLLAHGLVFTLRWSFGASDRHRDVYYLIAASGGALLVLLSCWGVDWFYLSSRYPNNPPYFDYPIHTETAQQVVGALRGRYHAAPPRASVRILFVGSSQTWGAGARDGDRAWPRLVEEALNRRGDGPEYQGVNGGISGADSSLLLRYFTEEWLRLNPRFVIINLSNNGVDPLRFTDDLRQFVRLTRGIGAGVHFVLEPISLETPRPDVFARHEIMRSVARELGVPVTDMNAYLNVDHDVGFLWWDQVHLTAAGQEIFAERLYRDIDRLVRSSPNEGGVRDRVRPAGANRS